MNISICFEGAEVLTFNAFSDSKKVLAVSRAILVASSIG